jgi:hypothetical protein
MPERKEAFITLELGHAPRGGKPPVDVGIGGTAQPLGFSGYDRRSARARAQTAANVAMQLPARFHRDKAHHQRLEESEQ